MTDSDKKALNRKIAAILGYTVKPYKWQYVIPDDYDFPEPLEGERVGGYVLRLPDSIWSLQSCSAKPEYAWAYIPQWANDLNAAFELFPSGVSIEFVAFKDGKYLIYIDGYWHIETAYDRTDLAYALSEEWVAWKAAQS